MTITEDDLSELSESLDLTNPYDTFETQTEAPDPDVDGVGPKVRASALKVAHRMEHEADVLHLIMDPKIWKEDFLQGDQDEEHRKAAWSELFFDLTYVAAGLKLGENLKADVSWAQAGEFALIFQPLFAVWLSVTITVNRFCMRDMLNKLVFVMIFICTVLAALHLDDGLGSHGAGFFSWLAAAYVVLSSLSIYIGCRLERARRVCLSDGYLGFLNAVLYVCIGLLPLLSSNEKQWRAVGIGVSYFLMAVLRHVRDRVYLRPPERNQAGHITMRGDHVPIHIGLMHERMALMIVIVLGESVLGIILPDLQQSAEFLSTAAFACVLICCIQYLYFEVDSLRFTKHAMQRRSFRCCFQLHPALFWLHGHSLLMVLSLMVGVGIKSSLSLNDSLKTKYRILLTASVAAALGLSFLLHIMHRLPSGFTVSVLNRGLVRLGVSMVIVAAGFIPKDQLPAWALMMFLALVSVALVLFEFFASRVKQVHGSKRPELNAMDMVAQQHAAVGSTRDELPRVHSAPNAPRSVGLSNLQAKRDSPRSRNGSKHTNISLEV